MLPKPKPLSRRFYTTSKCGSDRHLRKLLEYLEALRKAGVPLRRRIAK